MSSEDLLPAPEEFRVMRAKIKRALVRAVESILARYFPECDLVIEVRGGKCKRLHLRELDELA